MRSSAASVVQVHRAAVGLGAVPCFRSLISIIEASTSNPSRMCEAGSYRFRPELRCHLCVGQRVPGQRRSAEPVRRQSKRANSPARPDLNRWGTSISMGCPMSSSRVYPEYRLCLRVNASVIRPSALTMIMALGAACILIVNCSSACFRLVMSTAAPRIRNRLTSPLNST